MGREVEIFKVLLGSIKYQFKLGIKNFSDFSKWTSRWSSRSSSFSLWQGSAQSRQRIAILNVRRSPEALQILALVGKNRTGLEGRDGGQVVSLLTFYHDDPRSNPAEANNFFP